MELLELWWRVRILNMVCALLAFLIIPYRMFNGSTWDKAVPVDRGIARVAFVSFPFCYFFATLVASVAGQEPGIWSLVMTPPNVLSAVAAFWPSGWVPRGQRS